MVSQRAYLLGVDPAVVVQSVRQKFAEIQKKSAKDF